MRLRAILSPQLAVLVLGAGLAAAASQLPAEPAPADLRLSASAAGKLSARTLHVSSGAGFKLSRLVPGDTGTGTIVLTNRGEGPGTYELLPETATDVAGRFGGRLSRQLELVIEDVTGGGSRLLFAGKVGALRQALAVGEIAAGDTRTLKLTVDWEDGGAPPTLIEGDNAFVGASTQVLYKFRVTRPDRPAPVTATVESTGRFTSAARTCLSRRRFPIRVRVPRRFKPVSTRVLVDGKRVKVIKGRRLRATVDLRGKLPSRITVQIAVRGRNGKTIVGSRRYRTCVKPSLSKRPAKPPKV